MPREACGNSVEAPKDAVSKLSLSEGVGWSRRDLPSFAPPPGVLVRRECSRSGLAVAERLSVFSAFLGVGRVQVFPVVLRVQWQLKEVRS